jgi:hypothetical protein
MWNKENVYTRIILNLEENKLRKEKNAPMFPNSFRYTETGFEAGIGDSTKVFLKAGFMVRHTDSIHTGILLENRQSRSWFVSNRLLKNKHSLLEWNLNYRRIYLRDSLSNPFINASMKYHTKLAKGLINWQTRYENYSGNIIRQEYTYIQTEPGHGYYTWNDYNENGIPDPDEFEVALYSDQADYLRIALPNTRYIPTRKAGLIQNINFNFAPWQNKQGILSLLSHLRAGLSLHLTDDRIQQGNNLHWNPFKSGTDGRVSRKYRLSNHVNWRGFRQPYAIGYRYEEASQELVDIFGKNTTGLFRHTINTHYNLSEETTMSMLYIQGTEYRSHEVYQNKNYNIRKIEYQPSFKYNIEKKHSLNLMYSYEIQQNTLGEKENNLRRKWEVDYHYEGKNNASFDMSLNILFNEYSGDTNSPVAYTILEGLQPGRNITWNMVWTEKLNSFLYLHLLYDGRTSIETHTTIHNGSIKLSAGF